MEGIGETLKGAGELVDTDIDRLTGKIRDSILNPEISEEIEKNALQYAHEFSWKNQALKHYELAETAATTIPTTKSVKAPAKDPLIALTTGSSNEEISADPITLKQLLYDFQIESQFEKGNQTRDSRENPGTMT
ncbi:MAG: hypothetical protein R6U37_00245 [Dehalococcoidia bacterium]